MIKSLSKILCGTIFLLVTMGVACAEDETELAKKTQNPVADLISLPLQNNFNFDTGDDCVITLGKGTEFGSATTSQKQTSAFRRCQMPAIGY
jgi:hypothetical protein